MKKVLFICHSACYTGAPILLLNFLKWLKRYSNIPFHILIKNNGPLEKEFRKLAPVDLWNSDFFSNKYINKILNKIPLLAFLYRYIFIQKFFRSLPPNQIGLIYSSTITNGELYPFLKKVGCPVITHVHELEFWINKTGKNNFNQVKKNTDYYIAGSKAVKINLTDNHSIPKNQIEVIYDCIANIEKVPESKKIRPSLNIPQDAIIVGSSGSEVWRKGKDLFVQFAISVLRKCNNLPIYFVWVGGNKEDESNFQLTHDVKQAGIYDRIFFIPSVANWREYFAAFDIFAMISREDPYPLVNLEAALIGIPVLCFDNSGGSPEFVEDDAGFVIPYLDISEMADKVVLLANDSKLRKKLGENGKNKVLQKHLIDNTAPGVLAVIERMMH